LAIALLVLRLGNTPVPSFRKLAKGRTATEGGGLKKPITTKPASTTLLLPPASPYEGHKV
jgi:hypothetical protein